MAIIFIHGVNTRKADADYFESIGVRRVFFDRFVTSVLPHDQFEGFAVADDVYWGDLGVTFGWNLKTIPETRILQSLGAEDEAPLENPNLMLTLAETTSQASFVAEASAGGVQALGAPTEGLLAQAALKDPEAVVRSIFAPEAARFDPQPSAEYKKDLNAAAQAAAQVQGEELAMLLLAADQLAREASKNPALVAGESDAEVFTLIKNETSQRYEQLEQEQAAGTTAVVQSLGSTSDWVKKRIDGLIKAGKGAVDAATDLIRGTGEETARVTSLVAMRAERTKLSQKGLRFLGDVFVYLRWGHPPAGAIQQRVREGILQVAARKKADGNREPLVVVTHSFGSIILYDLLTSGQLDGIKIDLWVTAGAQVSLFAEMRLYGSSSPETPPAEQSVLGKPKQVTRWVNFYDAADILSYLHEPVFGKDAVEDIPVRNRANVLNAHGHYFVTPEFYQRIGAEFKKLLDGNKLT